MAPFCGARLPGNKPVDTIYVELCICSRKREANSPNAARAVSSEKERHIKSLLFYSKRMNEKGIIFNFYIKKKI